MRHAGNVDCRPTAPSAPGQAVSVATVAIVLGLMGLLVGLGATMAGTWIAYWHGAALISLASVGPEPDNTSLYLVVCGTVATILGGLSIYRSHDM